VQERNVYRLAGHFVRSKLRRLFGPGKLRRAASSPPIRLVIGASGVSQPNWTVTNIEYLNITMERHWERYFSPGTIHAMLAEHVWEHLSAADAIEATRLCRLYLRPGGYLRVAVPDGFHPDPRYIEYVKPGGTGPGASDHRSLFTYKTFRALFENAGFIVNLLEYFDEHGKFHFVEWSTAEGLINRSRLFDERNASGSLNYTSIILDASVPSGPVNAH